MKKPVKDPEGKNDPKNSKAGYPMPKPGKRPAPRVR